MAQRALEDTATRGQHPHAPRAGIRRGHPQHRRLADPRFPFDQQQSARTPLRARQRFTNPAQSVPPLQKWVSSRHRLYAREPNPIRGGCQQPHALGRSSGCSAHSRAASSTTSSPSSPSNRSRLPSGPCNQPRTGSRPGSSSRTRRRHAGSPTTKRLAPHLAVRIHEPHRFRPSLRALGTARPRGGPAGRAERRGRAGTLPAAVDLAIYRILEEALASARRQPASSIRVFLRFGEDDLELQLTAQCDGPSAWPTDAMRERAALCGGELHADQHAETGWQLAARLPRVLQGVLV
jgi:hypothetical protein